MQDIFQMRTKVKRLTKKELIGFENVCLPAVFSLCISNMPKLHEFIKTERDL